MRLDEGRPAAVRDTENVFDLAIDFTAQPHEITAALTALFQEAVDSKRWARRRGDARPNSST